jgi:hypothetical protein
MPPIQPNSEVPIVELNHDGTINVVVNVTGFAAGAPVEISGQVTQDNGAVATFYSVRPMPQSGPVNLPNLPVVPNRNFDPGFPITVVARASEVWISTLQGGTGSGPVQSNVISGSVQAAWTVNNANWAVAWEGQDAPAAWGSPAAPATAPSNLIPHGTWWDLKKADPPDQVMTGRFTRLFPDLPGARFNQHELQLLAEAMTAPAEESGPEAEAEENRTIPAAYTYLGQFADHDITFDPISHLRETLSPAQLNALVDFRTPRFDLDNLYGRGPDDQPYMYEEDGIHLLPGEAMLGHPFDPGAVQLPRGPSGRALIGDPRDDENRIIAQLHAIFLRFHNKLADRLGGKRSTSFQQVRDLVRWHYQWILVNDFLPAVVERQTYQSVFPNPYRTVTTIPKLRDHDLELMPVEFSVAAYRFGHSMVRPRYQLNEKIGAPIFSTEPGGTADLGGFRPIPADWAIDWQFFIDLDHGAGSAAGAGPGMRKPQLSFKIDTSLAHPLGDLPPRIAMDPSSLALRNLERGAIFQLPSGQSVARALGIPAIADKDLLIGKATADSQRKPITKVASGFANNAPLWAYILSEAQVTSWKGTDSQLAKDDIPIKLGPLGGRLVAEVFASLLRGDPTSYLNADHKFVPIKDFTHGGTFGLAELINIVLDRKP